MFTMSKSVTHTVYSDIRFTYFIPIYSPILGTFLLKIEEHVKGVHAKNLRNLSIFGQTAPCYTCQSQALILCIVISGLLFL